MKGRDARDSATICRQELRLACTKEAVAKKVYGKERREMIKTCAAQPKRERKKKS